MTFTSLFFALFVGVTIAIYYIFPLKRHQWVLLLFASYFFYAYNSFKYMAFILLTTVSIYAAAMFINRINSRMAETLKEQKGVWSPAERKEFKRKANSKKKAVLTSALLVNFGILFTIKYLNFLAGGLMSILGHKTDELVIVSIMLPLGISFYTFQATGYLIDVYRDTISAEKNIFKLALFVSFFPQIVQGPISEYEKLGNQLFAEHKAEWARFKLGGELILWGLFKKLVVADRMFNAINAICEDYTSYAGQMILFASLMYALQLYADFSGGIDIARGIAKVLGIDLELNFRQPYFSKNISEYWRRWHITLGAWMKKYVFYSLAVSDIFLGASRKIAKSRFGATAAGKHIAKTLPTAIASLIVFLLIGIWHGANSRYIGFGLWNGLIIMLSTLLMPVYSHVLHKLQIKAESFLWKAFQIFRTFIIVLVGYYFDIAPSFMAALDMMKRSIADFNLRFDMSTLRDIGIEKSDLLVIIYGALVMLWMSIRLEKTGLEEPGALLDRRSALVQWMVILIGALSVIVLGMYGSGTEGANFVYMGF